MVLIGMAMAQAATRGTLPVQQRVAGGAMPQLWTRRKFMIQAENPPTLIVGVA
jgi:hypothetical protein